MNKNRHSSLWSFIIGAVLIVGSVAMIYQQLRLWHLSHQPDWPLRPEAWVGWTGSREDAVNQLTTTIFNHNDQLASDNIRYLPLLEADNNRGISPYHKVECLYVTPNLNTASATILARPLNDPDSMGLIVPGEVLPAGDNLVLQRYAPLPITISPAAVHYLGNLPLYTSSNTPVTARDQAHLSLLLPQQMKNQVYHTTAEQWSRAAAATYQPESTYSSKTEYFFSPMQIQILRHVTGTALIYTHIFREYEQSLVDQRQHELATPAHADNQHFQRGLAAATARIRILDDHTAVATSPELWPQLYANGLPHRSVWSWPYLWLKIVIWSVTLLFLAWTIRRAHSGRHMSHHGVTLS